MSKWPMVKLGKVLKQSKKIKFAQNPLEEKLISVQLYGKGAIQRITSPEKAPRPFNGFIGREGQIVYSRIWARKGAIAKINQDLDGVVVTNEFPLFDVLPTANVDYLIQAFQSPQFKSKLEMAGSGTSGQNRIKETAFLALEVPLPPLGEQKRIAETLEQVTLAINTVQHNIENTLSFKKTAQDSIINANINGSTELSQIASIQSGITKGRKAKEDTPLKSVPYMAVSNVKAGRLDLSTVKKIDASEAEIDRYLLKTGDILLTEGGDPDKLGRGSIWRNEIQDAIHQNHIFRVRINPTSNFTSEALMAILESKKSKYYFLRSAKQTTGISSINKTQLSATPIPVLDQAQINEITRLWHDSEQIIALYRQKLALLQELQRSLSARAFAGEL